MFYVASREGHLPQVLSMIHIHRHTPLAAVLTLVSSLTLYHNNNNCLSGITLSPVRAGHWLLGRKQVVTGHVTNYVSATWTCKSKKNCRPCLLLIFLDGRDGLKQTKMNLRCLLQIPQISILSSICGMGWTNNFGCLKASLCNSPDLKDLLLPSWCQIP